MKNHSEKIKLIFITLLFIVISIIPANIFAAHDSTGKPTDLNNNVYLAINKSSEFPGEPVIYGGTGYTFFNSQFRTGNFTVYANKAETVLNSSVLDNLTQGTPDGNNKVWGIYSSKGIKNYLIGGENNPILLRTNQEKVIKAVLGNNIDASEYEIIWYVAKYQTNTGWHIDGIIKETDTYSVNYYGNGNTFGAAPNGDKNIEPGSSYTVLGNEGNLGKEEDGIVYKFMGWSEDANATKPTYVAGDVIKNINRNISLYAVWSSDISYSGTVCVELDGVRTNIKDIYNGSEIFLKSIDENNTEYIQLNNTDTGVYNTSLKDGVYRPWIKINNNYSAIGHQELIVSHHSNNITLHYYSVNYDTNGGEFKTSENPGVGIYYGGSTVTATKAIPEKEGYTFEGWKYNNTTYNSGEEVTNNIRSAITLEAIWEKNINVTINVTIDHQGDDGEIDSDQTKDELHVELLERENSSSPYIETGKVINFKNSGMTGYNCVQTETTTTYTATVPTFTGLESHYQYTALTSKFHYDVISVTETQDVNGNWIIDVQLKYDPENFDLNFSVEMANDVPKELYPDAVIAKVAYYSTDTNTWEIISQHAGDNPGVRVDIDSTTGKGSGSYPVFKYDSDGNIYGYRIIVSSFVYDEHKIVPANEYINGVIGTSYTDSNYTATIDNVSDGKKYDNLYGAYYHYDSVNKKDVQKGTLNAVIDIEKYDVTFDAQGGTVNNSDKQVVKDQYYIPSFSGYQPERESYNFMGWHQDTNLTVPAIENTLLTSDVTLYAKWNAIQTITGKLTLAGTYIQNGKTINVWDDDKAKEAVVVLQEITQDGIYNLDSQTVTIDWKTYSDKNIGVSNEYKFTGLDESKQYRISVFLVNYTSTYQNEETPITDDNNITNDYRPNDYVAVFNIDRTKTFVNAYLVFKAESYFQPVEIDAERIGEDFRPSEVLVDILYKLYGTDDSTYNVISQHTVDPEGIIINVDKTTGTSPNDDGEYIWKELYDGTLYVYIPRLKTTTINGKTENYTDTLPYYITRTVSRWNHATLEPTSTLLITFIPKQYNVIFDLNTTDTVTNMEVYLQTEGHYGQIHTWSFDTIIDAIPQRKGYEFMGWTTNTTGAYENGKINASVASDITLVAQWKKKDNLSYTVNYLEKDTNNKLSTSKVVDKQIYGAQVTENAITIKGYNVVGNTSETITIDEENNVINFYYTKKTDLRYKIEYYYNNIKDESKTENLNASYLSEINSYPDKSIKDYTLDYVEGLPLVIDDIEENNIIKVYYTTDIIRDSKIDEIEGQSGDNIPDKYQKKITFKVINGKWEDGSNEEILKYVTLLLNGNYDPKGIATISIPTNMIADDGYGNGSWDIIPREIVKGIDEEVYVYTFNKIQDDENIQDNEKPQNLQNSQNTENPQTGDNITIWFTLMLLSILGIFGLAIYTKKQN